MFVVNKELFRFSHIDKDNFFPQMPTIVKKKNKIIIFFSFRKRSEVKNLKPQARIGSIELNKNFKLIKEFKEIEIIKNKIYHKYALNGLMVTHIVGKDIYTTGWVRKKKFPFKTFVIKGLLIRNKIILKKVHFEKKLLTNGAFIYEEKKKKRLYFSLGLKWIKYKEKYEIIYHLYCYFNRKIKKIFTNSSINYAENRPSIIKDKSNYYLFFCRRYAKNFRNKSGGYRLFCSLSKDLIKWSMPKKITFKNKLIKKWNTQMQAYPFVFKLKNKILLAYNGNFFGKSGFSISEITNEN